MKTILKIFTLVLFLTLNGNLAQAQFIKAHDGKLWRGNKPYYFVGANLWYGAILASEGQGGNRARLARELDEMKRIGINNLRILVGADGEHGVHSKVEPTLQKAPGVYNDTILGGLDYLMVELNKRQMVAVLYLNNSWEWSGGYGFYLEHAGEGKSPLPNVDGYMAYVNHAKKFATNQKAQQLFYNYVKFIINRTNRYTGKRYVDDPAIMSWQIGNEPRAFSKDVLPDFVKWIGQSAALIRSLDPNHLISIGSEGNFGCEQDMNTYEQICKDPNIDYCNIHIWPHNWGWSKAASLMQDLPTVCKNTEEYIKQHTDLCKQLNKPLVLEEFGYPRDGVKYTLDTPTKARDKYYQYTFDQVAKHAAKGGNLVGCNFWAWGGEAKPKYETWRMGEPYTGDPAQEPQGLYSVFSSDKSTIKIIKKYCKILSSIK